MSTGTAGGVAADLRAGFEQAADALGSALDVEQRPVADALAALGAELVEPARSRWWSSRRRQPHGLYLHGPVGAGKTWMVDVLLDQLPSATWRRVHVYDAARALHAGVASRSGQVGALAQIAAGVWIRTCETPVLGVSSAGRASRGPSPNHGTETTAGGSCAERLPRRQAASVVLVRGWLIVAAALRVRSSQQERSAEQAAHGQWPHEGECPRRHRLEGEAGELHGIAASMTSAPAAARARRWVMTAPAG